MVTSKALSEDWQNRRYEPEKLWAYRPLKVEKYQRENTRWIGLLIEIGGVWLKGSVASARELYRRLSFG